MTDRTVLARLTAELVSSYVGNRSLSEAELDHAIDRLPALISRVHEALLKIVIDPPDEQPAALADPQPIPGESPRLPSGAPAASRPEAQKQTVFPTHLICLEDGLPFKTLKRHLAAHHGLTPEAYRKKWGLPDDYPMAAPAYAATRSAVARNIGLGAAGRGGKPGKVSGKKR